MGVRSFRQAAGPAVWASEGAGEIAIATAKARIAARESTLRMCSNSLRLCYRRCSHELRRDATAGWRARSESTRESIVLRVPHFLNVFGAASPHYTGADFTKLCGMEVSEGV